MNTIYKYPINITGFQEISMPMGAQIILVGCDSSLQPCVWAIVNPENKPQLKSVYISGTGQPLPDDCTFFASFMQGRFVWHVFLPVSP